MSGAYERSMELYRYIGRERWPSSDEIKRLWHQVFEAVLIRERFTRKAIDYMWRELAQGNWERLHQTDEERELDADGWLGKFREELFYCSDRWCLDRLMRCHWLFRQYMQAVTGRWWT